MGAVEDITGVIPVVVVGGVVTKMSDAAFKNAKSHYVRKARRKGKRK